ncbi:hypothetical protein CRI94_12500 [Longibacter salinarum]|uniref:Glycosyltransferase subfamily 4-like N-terminal domain-containing protein n=1 Tax=Longibacter salinarum TaxID=1850348 RepID=A0A2A8CVN9_9BACT|nr:glycosyltransferase [Longibacter salinarum]PEN12819.1 hypothetical protein CRI94_12500 [Longibacter salinarum]
MILSVQPFGLASPGGGARILRSLFEGAPVPILSVCTSPQAPNEMDTERERHLPVRPYFGRIEHTRLSYPISAVTLAYRPQFRQQLRSLCIEQDVKLIHAIPHGIDFWDAYLVSRDLGLPYILTVHDDLTYNLQDRVYLTQAMKRLATVWRKSDARMVISDAMGQAYNNRYGDRQYSVVTDGVHTIQPAPRSAHDGSFHLYFMGSVHMTYREPFQALVLALERLKASDSSLDVRLTVRGSIPFELTTGSVPVDVLGWGTQDDVEREIAEADALYLPLPFDSEFSTFVRFSLSTKMITYVASGVPILYHGPEQSAAADLLRRHDAGILSESLDPKDILSAVRSIPERRAHVVKGALELAESRFRIEEQRRRFWNVVLDCYPAKHAIAS